MFPDLASKQQVSAVLITSHITQTLSSPYSCGNQGTLKKSPQAPKMGSSKQALSRKASHILNKQTGIVTAQLGWGCQIVFDRELAPRRAASRRCKLITRAYLLGGIQMRGKQDCVTQFHFSHAIKACCVTHST